MEFTELADYPLPDGVLTEWAPTVTDGPRAWTVDERPLAYTHEAHCRHSLATSHEPDATSAWIGAVFEVHESFVPDAVAQAIRAWTMRHETFRTTVVEDEDTRDLTRLTVRSESVEVAAYTTGETRTGSAIHDRIVEIFDKRLSPFRWPHCLIITVHDDSDDSFLLAFGADHSVMDAYSMLLAVSELRRLYEQALRGTDPRLAETASHVDFSAVDRAFGDTLTADHDCVLSWSNFLTDKQFPAFPLALGAADDPHRAPERQRNLSSWLLPRERTDELANLARAHGQSMQTAVLAALGVTARRLVGAEHLKFTMPMHTRFEKKYAESVGWYVGVVPIDMTLVDVESWDDALPAAAEAIDSTAGYARLPYSKIADILGIESAPRFVVSYLDLRHTPDAIDWPLWQARTLRGGTSSRSEVYLWILRTPLGLNISARFPSDEIATTNVHAFVAEFSSTLKALTAADTSKAGEEAGIHDHHRTVQLAP